MIAWLRRVLFGSCYPMPTRADPAPARESEPSIHEARNLRTAIRANAELTERLMLRERRHSTAVAETLLRARDRAGGEV